MSRTGAKCHYHVANYDDMQNNVCNMPLRFKTKWNINLQIYRRGLALVNLVLKISFRSGQKGKLIQGECIQQKLEFTLKKILLKKKKCWSAP